MVFTNSVVCYLETSVIIRWVSLLVLILQNATLVLVMRYARTRPGNMFFATTAVVMAEVMKLTFCLGVTLYEHHGSISDWLKYLSEVRCLCGFNTAFWFRFISFLCVFVFFSSRASLFVIGLLFLCFFCIVWLFFGC